MKALSIRQPWAWAILHAGKMVENRRWNTHYRGPVLLHAAKGCTRGEFSEACVWMENAGVVATMHPMTLGDLPRGGIVGRARIAGVIAPGDEAQAAAAAANIPGLDLRWWMRGQYGFVLVDVEPLPFRPCTGALRLFDVPEAA